MSGVIGGDRVSKVGKLCPPRAHSMDRNCFRLRFGAMTISVNQYEILPRKNGVSLFTGFSATEPRYTATSEIGSYT